MFAMCFTLTGQVPYYLTTVLALAINFQSSKFQQHFLTHTK